MTLATNKGAFPIPNAMLAEMIFNNTASLYAKETMPRLPRSALGWVELVSS